jgi:excisionase family DNA binding protein
LILDDLDRLSSTLITRRARARAGVRPRVVDDRWLSVDEIADYLSVVKASIYRWIERRNLPAHKLGKLWKFKRDEVDAWVRSGGAVDPTPLARRRRRRGQNQR